jgi:hypothetical protein
MELLLWVLGGLLTILAGLVLHIFSKLNNTVNRIEIKLDELEKQNALDHAIVQGRLAKVEERTGHIQDAVQSLSSDHDELRGDVAELDRKVVLLRGSVN